MARKNKKRLKLLKGLYISFISLIIIAIVYSAGYKLYIISENERAKNLTINSPIFEVGQAHLWVESTLNKSLNKKNRKNNKKINIWNDISGNNNNLTQYLNSKAPKYEANAINGLPAVGFNGKNNYLNFNNKFLTNNKGYTIFVVEQRKESRESDYFIGGDNTRSNFRMALGYKNNQIRYYNGFPNIMNINIDKHTKPIARVHTFHNNNLSEKKYYLNGILKSNINNKHNIEKYKHPIVGGEYFNSNFYYGYIGEIIIYDHTLNNRERSSIEEYLIEKWKIKKIFWKEN